MQILLHISRVQVMRPRLRQVAKLAGVSEATVSRVVNGRPGVAEATRRDVVRALERLGYQPTGVPAVAAARRMVAVIVPDLVNPVFPAFGQAVEAALSRQGITTVLCTATAESIQEVECFEALGNRGIDGFVVVSGLNSDTSAEHSHYARLAEAGRALVLVNGPLTSVDLPAVSADEVAGAELAVRHLLDLGHRRIGLATGPRRYLPTQRKLQGYDQALTAAGIEVDPALQAETVLSVEGGRLAMEHLLDQGATGVLTGSDLMALGAVGAARERGLAVPADISVVGYDDIPLAGYTDPPLTTLRQPVIAMGAAAAGLLTDELEGKRPAHQGELLFRAELIARGSTGHVRG